MPTVAEGRHGKYLWLESSLELRAVDRPLNKLTQNCPDVLLNKRVVITSLDSAPLRLNDQQIKDGWKRAGKLAISPPISNAGEVPFQWFDEWYIFEDGVPTALDIKTFVNYGTFSLGEPNPTIDTMYIGTGSDFRAQMVAAVAPLRQTFWTQFESLDPESYVSNGNCFIFVTRNPQLHQNVNTLMRSL